MIYTMINSRFEQYCYKLKTENLSFKLCIRDNASTVVHYDDIKPFLNSYNVGWYSDTVYLCSL